MDILRSRKLTPTDTALLERARSRGWLEASGLDEDRQRQKSAWFLWCHEERLDWLCLEQTAEGVVLEGLVPPMCQLSSIAYAELEQLIKSLGLDGSYGGVPSGFRFDVPRSVDGEDLALRVLEILRRDRTPERAVELEAHAGHREGMAVALDMTGLWPDLEPHHGVYVREIPGRPGRCIALRHKDVPLVDLPMSQFRILSEQDV